ncbi:MAG: septation protein A [Gammaproteobacteria bacterium]|nr:septation protein A [Gammaproteobacteria bacterium]
MKFLTDFFPIILFFIAYKMEGIYVATGVAIAASFIQVAGSWLINRKVEKMHLITFAILAVFGGATLLFHDPLFIKWKPTVINWLFAAVFLGSQFIGEKPIIERMMGHALSVDRPIWNKLNIAWVIFFIISGLANIYVAFNYDENTWVNFKLFGLMGMTFVFVIGQAFFLAKYMPTEDQQTISQETSKDNKP